MLPYLPPEAHATLPASKAVTAVTDYSWSTPLFFGRRVIDVQSPMSRPCPHQRAERLSFLIAFTQHLFDSLHDWHLKILLVAAIIRHLAHIFLKGLQINHSVVAFGIIVTAEPRGDEPRLTDFVMHELVTVDFRNVDRHLGLGRPGGCKGKDGYQGDADALPWHKTLLSRNRNFSKAAHRLYRFCQPLGRLRAGVNTGGGKMGGTPDVAARGAAGLPRFVQKKSD